ncbi:MAG: GNAT family N-acetyltransferase [candidate division Zixibacteria bacterium]|nr:GNAT family N-acetyltransferase [candidate division Zixibacteria bacterium]
MKVKEPQTTGSQLQFVVERSIRRIDATVWDSINASCGLYWTHRFLSCMESSGVADATYWYLLVYRGNELVATAVLTSFVVSLDLLLPRYVQRLCGAVRHIWPSFFRLRMLFCGIPISIGKHTLAFSDKVSAEELLDSIDHRMTQIARAGGIRFLCFKEFVDSDFPEIRKLENSGYIRAHSIPRVRLNVNWPSFGDYLQSMRHGYRRRIRQSLSQLGITDYASSSLLDSKTRTGPRLAAAAFRPEHVTRMHALYLEVMRRATVKLEVLNRCFFEQLTTFMPNDLVLLYVEDKGNIQGTALLGRSESNLNFLLAGIDYEHRDQYQTYFNLLNGIIAYGIEHGFGSIDLGQTTYQAKQRLGGKVEPVYFYLRCLSPVIHLLVRCFNQVLFPATRLQRWHVFRESND